MSDAIEPTLWHRMRYTPLRDAVRGEISGRLDIERRLGIAALDAPINDLIRKVLKRTRLWRIEKADVADELIAHFADGIESGESAESLVESFGDPRAAAELIRRAVQSKRSLFWKVMSALRWLCVAMVAFYVISGAVFFMGKPTIKTNYVAALNRDLQSYSIDQQGWPLYRKVILGTKESAFLKETDPVEYLLDAHPGSPRWTELVAWLKTKQEPIALARSAAAKPVLGFEYGPSGSAYDAELWQDRAGASANEPYPMMASVLLPHLNELRHIANILAADARLAADEGDTRRFLSDVEAIFGIADQLVENSFLVQQLVALGIRTVGVRPIAEVLATKPELLSSDDLQRLAHRLAKPASTLDMLSLDQERALFYDVVQRMYTDDGNGDGRLTRQGVDLLNQFDQPAKHEEMLVREASALTAPVLLPTRREIVEYFDRWMDLAAADLKTPARDVRPDTREMEFAEISQSFLQRIRYDLLVQILPATGNLQASGERYLGARDGVFIAIATEVYRRQHQGQWPATLDELSPALLPAVPVDRITGGPLRYRIEEGQPLVYSVGVDRDDDAGRAPLTGGGDPDPSLAAHWHKGPPQNMTDGDWVLYPPVE